MRETKRRIPQFAFYDKTGIQAYLEEQAKQGWMLQKISYGWVFRRTTPQKLHFFVSYFHKKSVFDADGSEEQRRFWEFCEHAGWKLAATNEQMQIFYNEQEEPVPIETDAVVEVEKIHRSAGKSFLLPYTLLLIAFFLQIGSRIERMCYDPLEILTDDMNLLILCSWCLLAVYEIREIVRYFLWYRKAVRMAVTEGIFAPTKGVGKAWSMIPYFAIVCVAAGVLLLGDRGMSHAFFVMCIMFGVSTVFITGVSRWMRRAGVRAAFNRLAVVVLTVLVCIVTIQQLFMMIIRGELFPGREAAETYEYNGWTYEVYHDSLPLTVEDLFGVDSGAFHVWYSCELTKKESVFLVRSEAMQDPRVDAQERQDLVQDVQRDAGGLQSDGRNSQADGQGMQEDADIQRVPAGLRGPGEDAEELPVLLYTVTEVKAPFLYDWCQEKIMDADVETRNVDGEIRMTEMRRIEEEPWGADAAYRLYRDGEGKREYVVCYGDVILELSTSWDLTKEQMAVVGEKIGGKQ